MNKEVFNERKSILIDLINEQLITDSINGEDRKSLTKLLELLNQYSFENKLQKKGLLTRVIIDSLELDYSLGEKFIEFDNAIK